MPTGLGGAIGKSRFAKARSRELEPPLMNADGVEVDPGPARASGIALAAP